jgi:hypothetical protein
MVKDRLGEMKVIIYILTAVKKDHVEIQIEEKQQKKGKKQAEKSEPDTEQSANLDEFFNEVCISNCLLLDRRVTRFSRERENEHRQSRWTASASSKRHKRPRIKRFTFILAHHL